MAKSHDDDNNEDDDYDDDGEDDKREREKRNMKETFSEAGAVHGRERKEWK